MKKWFAGILAAVSLPGGLGLPTNASAAYAAAA